MSTKFAVLYPGSIMPPPCLSQRAKWFLVACSCAATWMIIILTLARLVHPLLYVLLPPLPVLGISHDICHPPPSLHSFNQSHHTLTCRPLYFPPTIHALHRWPLPCVKHVLSQLSSHTFHVNSFPSSLSFSILLRNQTVQLQPLAHEKVRLSCV